MKTIGINISKAIFDVWSEKLGHQKFSNDKEGFKAFKTLLNKEDHGVMEATGCYHFPLANYLYEKGIKVSVENPLVIKRFIQMKQQKVKTDKQDAMMICHFGMEQKTILWEPEPLIIEQGKLIISLVQTYVKQQTQLKNKYKSLQSGGVSHKVLLNSLKRQLKQIQTEIKKLEMELEALIKTNYGQELTSIRSIKE